MGWIQTEDLVPGTRVLVGNRGLIRTVASLPEATELAAHTDHGPKPIYRVRYEEGDTEEWPAFNWVLMGVWWPTPHRPHRPSDSGIWDEGPPTLEWDRKPKPPTTGRGKHRAEDRRAEDHHQPGNSNTNQPGETQ